MRRKPEDADKTKTNALRSQCALNGRAESVTHPLFRDSDFFDARDLVQVKYELLRRVRVDGATVKSAAEAFGLSRPSYYEAQAAFDSGGLPGLVPKKRGPRGAHKLTDKVLDFAEDLITSEGVTNSFAIASRIAARFGLQVHPRSVERALRRREKKRL